MRTTIRLDDDLLREAKQYAAESGRTFTCLVEDALREALRRRQRSSAKKRIRLKSGGQGGVQAGVDLDDSSALLDLMEFGH